MRSYTLSSSTKIAVQGPSLVQVVTVLMDSLVNAASLLQLVIVLTDSRGRSAHLPR